MTAVLFSCAAATARAQSWAVDLYAGRALYDEVSASIEASSLAGGVRYGAPGARWIHGVLGVPLDETAPAWAALGGSTACR